ncbi:MAG: matrixin family metalloprotease [Actinomycetota bacterium]|nr:matrixin family metalloprotease [Actinomycetota bacterium]
MDQPSAPTAAELGISDAAYERILRDMGQRGRGGEPPAAASRKRSTRRLPLVVLGLIAALAILLRLGAADPDDREPTYAFLKTVDGQPVTYSSCRLIQVAVYPAGGPPNAEQLVREAVALMRTATGLDIVVTGAFGGHAPNWNYEAAPIHPDDPISVSWHDGDAIAELTDHTAGLGGSRAINGPNGSQRLVAGTIALSRDYYTLLTERGDDGEALAVLLHEFGHVFGLDHVDSPRELMYDDNSDLTSFGPGDLEGLRLLGQGPCT